MAPIRIYLAGPEVFLPDAAAVGEAKKALCRDYGFLGLFPLDNEEERDDAIYRGNVHLMRFADFGVFNLTPFRGASADVGTAFELGFMKGLGKPCFAYSNDARSLRQRIEAGQTLERDAAGLWRDAEGLMVEDFGDADNLMLDCSLRDEGAPFFRNACAPERTLRDLAGFEACLKAIRARLAEEAQ